MMNLSRNVLSLVLVLVVGWSAFAQEVKREEPAKSSDRAQLYKQLEQQLTGAKFIGKFTTTGKDEEKLKTEEYTILSAKKAEHGEFWLLEARIQYGDKDITVPVPIAIEWAGTTPVMTLDKIALYGVGTFSARVVIHDGKYAGTWQHDQVGGHLFGKIEKAPAAKPAEAEKNDAEKK